MTCLLKGEWVSYPLHVSNVAALDMLLVVDVAVIQLTNNVTLPMEDFSCFQGHHEQEVQF